MTEELPDTNKEIKRKCCFLHKVKETISISFELISKWMTLVYVIAYVTRFISNCKANKEKLNASETTQQRRNKKIGD